MYLEAVEPLNAVVPNRGAGTHRGAAWGYATSCYISMDIRPILIPRGAVKYLNDPARVQMRHKKVQT